METRNPTLNSQKTPVLFKAIMNVNYLGVYFGNLQEHELARVKYESRRYLISTQTLVPITVRLDEQPFKFIELTEQLTDPHIDKVNFVVIFSNDEDEVKKLITRLEANFQEMPLIFMVHFNKESINKNNISNHLTDIIPFDSQEEKGIFWILCGRNLLKYTDAKPVDGSNMNPIKTVKCITM